MADQRPLMPVLCLPPPCLLLAPQAAAAAAASNANVVALQTAVNTGGLVSTSNNIKNNLATQVCGRAAHDCLFGPFFPPLAPLPADSHSQDGFGAALQFSF